MARRNFTVIISTCSFDNNITYIQEDSWYDVPVTLDARVFVFTNVSRNFYEKFLFRLRFEGFYNFFFPQFNV